MDGVYSGVSRGMVVVVIFVAARARRISARDLLGGVVVGRAVGRAGVGVVGAVVAVVAVTRGVSMVGVVVGHGGDGSRMERG